MSSKELETAMRGRVPFVVLIWVDTAYGLITTAPYMHDGRLATLEEVVDLYDRGGLQNPHLSNLMIPLGLTAAYHQLVASNRPAFQPRNREKGVAVMTIQRNDTVEIRRKEDRFQTYAGWLQSRDSFSFANHYDPTNTHHGLLLVHNDDLVKPNTGFRTHPHQDMEIVTWC